MTAFTFKKFEKWNVALCKDEWCKKDGLLSNIQANFPHYLLLFYKFGFQKALDDFKIMFIKINKT